jgi:hypothetical protein
MAKEKAQQPKMFQAKCVPKLSSKNPSASPRASKFGANRAVRNWLAQLAPSKLGAKQLARNLLA